MRKKNNIKIKINLKANTNNLGICVNNSEKLIKKNLRLNANIKAKKNKCKQSRSKNKYIRQCK